MYALLGEGFTELMLWLVVGGAALWRERNETNPLIDDDIDYARFWTVTSYNIRSHSELLASYIASWHRPDRSKDRWY